MRRWGRKRETSSLTSQMTSDEGYRENLLEDKNLCQEEFQSPEKIRWKMIYYLYVETSLHSSSFIPASGYRPVFYLLFHVFHIKQINKVYNFLNFL